jgi:Mn2+/Fe2+ NRAMP family transporter
VPTLRIAQQNVESVASIVLTCILVLANRRSVLGDAVSGRACRIAATLSVAAVAAMSLLLVGQTLLGLIGLG